MRRRVKRRMFLMGMALAAGAIGHAHAKGGRLGPEGREYSAWPADQLSSLPFDQTSHATAIPDGLLGRFKAMLEGLDYSVVGGLNEARRPRLGLQVFQPEAVTGVSDDPRVNGKQVGMALRISF